MYALVMGFVCFQVSVNDFCPSIDRGGALFPLTRKKHVANRYPLETDQDRLRTHMDDPCEH